MGRGHGSVHTGVFRGVLNDEPRLLRPEDTRIVRGRSNSVGTEGSRELFSRLRTVTERSRVHLAGETRDSGVGDRTRETKRDEVDKICRKGLDVSGLSPRNTRKERKEGDRPRANGLHGEGTPSEGTGDIIQSAKTRVLRDGRGDVVQRVNLSIFTSKP